MKKIFTLVLTATSLVSLAQWSNTSNYFLDSLHMAVSTALLSQKNPILLTSYPDNGYFVIWQDTRNSVNDNSDIYAQKYDKTGKRLWAADGVAIVSGPNNQHYTFSSSQDYRSRNFAATDSAGGFYICFSDDSVSNYVWERATVQHVRSNGTGVFASPGYILARSNAANMNFSSQLIADGNKGFFVAYRGGNGYDIDNLYVYNYRDENGSLRFYGGGKVNENALQTSVVANCGIKTDVIYPGTTLTDFNIWGDLDGGCNVIMGMVGNGPQGTMLAYNKVWKAKKNSRVKTFFRNTSGSACPRITNYVKGDAYVLYILQTDYQRVACGGGSGPVYAYTNYRLLSNGFQLIDDNTAYDYNFAKGTTLATNGNINVNVLAVTKRTLLNNVLSNFYVMGYTFRDEKFDSIPYQRCSQSNPEIGFNPIVPLSLNKLNPFRDTLLGYSNYYPDFSLAGGGNSAYAATLMSTTGYRMVRLQHLAVNRQTNDSFAIKYQTNIASNPEKTGVAIGSELANISFDLPRVSVAKNGQALFYIREYYKYARVSPISSGVELAWGAMGKPVGTGVYNGSLYRFEQIYATQDSTGSSGLISWQDSRYIPGDNSGDNIYMRHLDKLDVHNYLPPVKKIILLPNYYGPSYINPSVLLGTSKNYTALEVYSSSGTNPGTSPIIDILDDNYLGQVQATVNQHSSSIRRYLGRPYLNRNYTIKSDSVPPNLSISMVLYFTTEEFNALKAADFSIADPGYLSVIRQPSTVVAAGTTYAPVAGEEVITPLSWDSVDGGYAIRFLASGTGNFFVQKMLSTSVCASVNTTFTSNITGTTYQWLVSTGGNFLAISNDANYSGTATASLKLTNIPASFNGYRYRCLIDNTKLSNAFYLQVANTWTGAVNNLWETAGNWSCGAIPDANTDVIINSGAPTINSNSATCRSIIVSPGASVNVTAGFKLTVTH